MLRGMLTLMIFQFLGECLVKLFTLKIPAPIIGMVLLLIFLFIRKRSFDSLDVSVFWLLRYLPLFIIPAAAGIITQFDVITKEFWAISISLILGTILSLVLSVKLMDFLIGLREKN